MMNALRLRHIGITLVMILAVSLAGLGFMHKAPSGKDQALAVFAATGATLADFCGDDSGAPGDPCPACRLVTALIFPPQMPGIRPADQRLVMRVDAPIQNPRAQQVFDPARALRGPPLV